MPRSLSRGQFPFSSPPRRRGQRPDAWPKVLVQSFKRGDSAAIATTRAFLESSGAFDLVTLTRDDYVRTAHARAAFNLTMADALHIAAARAA